MFENAGLKVVEYPFKTIGNSRVMTIKSYLFSRRVDSAYLEGEIHLSDTIDPLGAVKRALLSQNERKPLGQYKENRVRYFKMQAEEDGDGEL